MSADDPHDPGVGAVAPSSLEGVLSQRQAEYLAAISPASLQEEYLRGPTMVAICVAYALLATPFLWIGIGVETSPPVVLAISAPFVAGFVLMWVAWAARAKSRPLVGVAGWYSLVVLGLVLAFEVVAVVASAVGFYQESKPDPDAFEGSLIPVFAVGVIIVAMIAAVPTIIGLVSSVGLVGRVRRG